MIAVLALQETGDAVRSAAEEGFKLWGDYSLADPWFLLLVPIGLAAVLWGRTRAGRDRARVPALTGVAAGRTLAQRSAFCVPLFEFGALLFVAVALARPLRGSEETLSESEGVDIAIVLDHSGSMERKDLDPNATRLDVIKDVVHDFAVRRMSDTEGAADNVALIAFAAYPEMLCPFTLDVDAITGFLKALKPVDNRAEDGTAIGVGLSKAVKVLMPSKARSRIVILLTDGENNIDGITPEDAANLAAENKIKVYTIFAGRYVYVPDMFGNPRPTEREIDTSELQEIAHKTGGRFYRARNREQLEKIYGEIEQLERTKRVEHRYTQTFDLYPSFLALALGLHLAAWLLGASFLRRLP
ncbi:MAG: VWA domain-containing protein [Planctomycetes bacterium]|nr:VWA domain-containing protein [Planctomycetota bacterium]